MPYRLGGEARVYLPDFIVLADDGRGANDPLHLVVEVKGRRLEDAKTKKETMETQWLPGVNRGRLRPLGVPEAARGVQYARGVGRGAR